MRGTHGSHSRLDMDEKRTAILCGPKHKKMQQIYKMKNHTSFSRVRYRLISSLGNLTGMDPDRAERGVNSRLVDHHSMVATATSNRLVSSM
jgi:hypothetical protein